MHEDLQSLHLALRESEGWLQRVLDSSPFGFHQYDLVSGQQLVVTGGNRAAAELFGVDSAQQLGKPMEEAFPFLAATELPAHIFQVVSRGESLSARELPLQIGSRALTVRVSIEALSDGRAAVFFQESTAALIDQIRQEASGFRQVFESASDAILVVCDGRVVECNPQAVELFNRSQSELLGKSIPQLSPEHQPDGALSESRALELESRALAGERLCVAWTHRRQNGATFVVESTLSRAVIGGRPHVVIISRDSSERNRLEERLRQTQKMEAVSRLAGRMAHDFNNFLTVINGYAAWMTQYVLPEDPLCSQVAEIQRAGQNAAELTQRLLSFSRHEALDLYPLDLNQVVASSLPLDLVRELAAESIDLRLKLQRPIGPILGDESSLRQMTLALVANAREAMPAGGVLLVETREAAHPGDGLISPGIYAQLLVTDTGIGMDEAVRSRAFDPYYTTKEPGRPGLGLSLVHGIVKRCGGHIEVTTAAGRGSAFAVYFPAQAGKASPAVTERHVQVDTLFGTETVLVVDDHEQVRRFATMTLQQYGYQVLETSDPREALVIGNSHASKISLLITDLVMPSLSGIELARSLRVSHPGLGVLLLTGYSEPKTAIEELDPPCAVLEKPFQPDALASMVREVLHSGHRPARILVVDDDAAVREFLCFVLEQQGYEVEQARDGREAIALVKASPVDLLITDLVMPEIEGLETIQTLRKLQPELLIIAISGYQDGRFLSIASKLGSSATLAKPVAPAEFLEAVRTVLRPAARSKLIGG